MSVEAVRRIDQAVSDDWATRVHAHESRVAGCDGVRLDGERQVALWTREGKVVLDAHAELVGVFFPELGLFRWWWSGKEHAIHLTPTRLDEAFAHAQRADVRALLTRQHQLDGVDDAAMLCRVAAYFAHAQAMLQQEHEDRVSYYAVFDEARRTVPPPPKIEAPISIVPDLDLEPRGPQRDSRPGGAWGVEAPISIVRTIPPPAVAPVTPAAPQLEPPAPQVMTVREPTRALVLPLLHVASKMIRQAFGGHARSALLIVNVDTSRDKARFYVTLVAATESGELAAVDTTRELLDAAGTMLGEDSRSGNGRWRKLVLSIDCEGEGAAIRRCEVKA